MRISCIVISLFLVAGCSGSHQSAPLTDEHANQPLTEEQAKSLARKLATDKGFELGNAISGEGMRLTSGHWIWTGSKIGPHGHVESATVELAP
ncbi:MAG: hypothetical protein ABSG04_03795, partial [Verrucomicrobiota bacterium]